ncbi:sperm-associated antigen 8 isoform X2 [Alligator mississippiensis]|uniref:sperm-associated antigen 8 isoform X2 n=1 Tax=Alligator mississippiensis TaxID=8496 RepID=UPI002877CC83|nr:sperm-associated antigen 8 isoform X2 [Alligator mississippiensis]
MEPGQRRGPEAPRGEETLREHCPRPAPMESLSTMRQDYRREGFCSAPPPPTQPHDYRMEQPRSFWLENAARIPGVTKPRAGDTPFKRNAAFSTPVEDSPWGWHRPGTVSPSEPRPLLPPTLGKALAISGFR